MLGGFTWLRFRGPLEREYLSSVRPDQSLLRITLAVGTILWLLFAVLDHLLISSSERWWMSAVRLVVLAVLLGCGALLWRGQRQRLEWMSMASIAALGVGAAVVVASPTAWITTSYEGLLLVSMAGYFLAGLRAPGTAGFPAGRRGLRGWRVVGGFPAGATDQQPAVLLSGSVVGAVGCYLLEYKSRESYKYPAGSAAAGRSRRTDQPAWHRHGFNRQMTSLWRQGQRDGVPLSLLIADVDHFKAYNDAYGHHAGDHALAGCGQVVEGGRGGRWTWRCVWAASLPCCSTAVIRQWRCSWPKVCARSLSSWASSTVVPARVPC